MIVCIIFCVLLYGQHINQSGKELDALGQVGNSSLSFFLTELKCYLADKQFHSCSMRQQMLCGMIEFGTGLTLIKNLFIA